MQNKQLNIEIKAKSTKNDKIRSILVDMNANFKGVDTQYDTYFNCDKGRFKLREGTIENSLIFYDRETKAGPKRSDIHYYHPNPESNLKDLLVAACGMKIEVRKTREIYHLDNVIFHIDEVEGLGSFIEIEVFSNSDETVVEELYKQCNYYLELLGIDSNQLIEHSYSDMLMDNDIQEKK